MNTSSPECGWPIGFPGLGKIIVLWPWKLDEVVWLVLAILTIHNPRYLRQESAKVKDVPGANCPRAADFHSIQSKPHSGFIRDSSVFLRSEVLVVRLLVISMGLKQLVINVAFRKCWEDWVPILKNCILILTLTFADSVALAKPFNLQFFSFICTCPEHVARVVFFNSCLCLEIS